jgi:4-hydroxy-2-oxoheptanedioate aldolase
MKDSMNVIDTRLPELLRGSRPLLGMFVGMPVPGLVEMCGHAGFDFVIVDNEHGPAGIESTERMLRAARGAGIIPVVRKLGVRYLPMVISGLIGNALRSAVAGAREAA